MIEICSIKEFALQLIRVLDDISKGLIGALRDWKILLWYAQQNTF